jgi:LmbE family N-acetylglucosaminyl deacetylase
LCPSVFYGKNAVMEWVYLSPHLDDAILSCGGLIWEQSQAGEAVSNWTICAGDPPSGQLSPFAVSLHRRWETGEQAGELRRKEDAAANRVLGASYLHFPFPDCIYRQGEEGRFLYDSEQSLFGVLHPEDERTIIAVYERLEEAARPGGMNLVCPLTLGGHVDHLLTRASAELWQLRNTGVRLWYYADYPYAQKDPALIEAVQSQGWLPQVFPVSKDGLEAWIKAVAAYESQISTFWQDFDEMKASLRAYWLDMGGIRLWKTPQPSSI